MSNTSNAGIEADDARLVFTTRGGATTNMPQYTGTVSKQMV